MLTKPSDATRHHLDTVIGLIVHRSLKYISKCITQEMIRNIIVETYSDSVFLKNLVVN